MYVGDFKYMIKRVYSIFIVFFEKKFVIKLLFIFFIERFRYWIVVKDLLESVKVN